MKAGYAVMLSGLLMLGCKPQSFFKGMQSRQILFGETPPYKTWAADSAIDLIGSYPLSSMSNRCIRRLHKLQKTSIDSLAVAQVNQIVQADTLVIFDALISYDPYGEGRAEVTLYGWIKDVPVVFYMPYRKVKKKLTTLELLRMVTVRDCFCQRRKLRVMKLL